MLILKWLMGLVTGPIFGDILKGYQDKLAAGNTSEQIAATLAARELAVQQVEIQAQTQLKIAEIGHPWEPEKLAFYIVLAYFAKCIVWDKMLGLGTTDTLGGDVKLWASMIMSFYFGKRSIESALRIIKR